MTGQCWKEHNLVKMGKERLFSGDEGVCVVWGDEDAYERTGNILMKRDGTYLALVFAKPFDVRA